MPPQDSLTKDIRSEASIAMTKRFGKSYFLGIGIDEYTTFPKLNNAVKDVKDIAAKLVQDYDIEAPQIELLLDDVATRKNIIGLLDHFKATLAEADKLIIYYSGHGHLDRWKKGYWIPIDAERENSAQYIRNATIIEFIEDMPALHVLLISDACFSGSIFYKGKFRSGEAIDAMEQLKSRWALCSGRHDEEVADGPPGQNSPFASSILYVLQQNNADKLNISKLVERVLEMTRANYQQLPEGSPMQGVDHRGGQYVFRKKGIQEEVIVNQAKGINESNSKETIRSFKSPILSAEIEEVRKWLWNLGAFVVVVVLIILMLGFSRSATLNSIVLGLIPILFYTAPYFAAYFSELKKRTLLILTSGYALVYYTMLLFWKLNRGDAYSWSLLVIMFLVGLLLYNFLLPYFRKNY